jgi:predicted RecB family endonuclease
MHNKRERDMTKVQEHVAAAKLAGYTPMQMLDNLDAKARQLGNELTRAICDGVITWDGGISRIMAEASTLRAYRQEFVDLVLCSDE